MSGMLRLAAYGIVTVGLAIAVPKYTGLTMQDVVDIPRQVKTSVAAAQSAVAAFGGGGGGEKRAADHGGPTARSKAQTPDPGVEARAKETLTHVEKVSSPRPKGGKHTN